MPFQRKALSDLKVWRKDAHRKPLVIRGARQVGKSTLVRMLGTSFDFFIELNAEKQDVQELFRQHTDVGTFLEAVYLQQNLITPGGDILLFIDEIQESPEAIRLLRYFYEEAPEIFVIAAGSLLDFSLGEVRSFPVGRVSYYFLHPLTFPEFLAWRSEEAALHAFRQMPIPIYAHEKLRDLFHEYTMVGGMPEIVARFSEGNPISLLQPIFEDLWQAYLDDIEKYASNNTQRQILRHIIRSAPTEQDRITFAGFGRSNYGSREVSEALRNLELARVLQLIYPTTRTKPPVVSDFKKRPKLQFLDTGLLNHALRIQPQFLNLEDLHHLHRGFILQHVLTQELQSLYTRMDVKPHFWVREKGNSNAEVDLVYPFRDKLLPIEIKAGKQGRLRSLHQYVEQAEHSVAVRFLNNTFSVEEYQTPNGTPYTLINLPYYSMARLEDYLDMVLS